MSSSDDSSGRIWRRSDVVSLAPAIALALLSLAAGTLPGTATLFGLELPGGASAVGAVTLHLLLLTGALFAAPAWREPLALGFRGRFLPLALWATVAAACWASPVPRAGWIAVVLLPAWSLLPAAVARCWRGTRERRRGTLAIACVVLAVAAIALADRGLAGSPRAAMPLGHHNLLAVWLLALLPVAALPARSPGPGRWLAVVAVGGGGAALFATESLAGALGAVALLAGGALLAAARRGDEGRRRRPLLAAVAASVALATLLLAAPRLTTVIAGDDPSSAVRATYFEAGWRGVQARPLLGWGPGATPWTIGEWMRPRPGVNPPQEVVGDLHSSPLHLLYELGFTGLLLALAVTLLFPWRRLIALPVALDRGAVLAGLLGLGGAGVSLLAVAPLAIPALPAALAVAAGTALAGEGPRRTPLRRRGRGSDLPVYLYVGIALFLLFPLDRAHLAHDRSLAAVRPVEELVAIAEAARLDPEFPLYRLRLAHLTAAETGGAGIAAAEGLAAAEAAWGVGVAWLMAGQAALAAGEPWAAIALERACRLDALGAQAPWLLALAAPTSVEAPRRAARALAAEPRLAAALAWRRFPGLREEALTELSRWDGIDPGWRRTMVEAAAEAHPDGGSRRGVARLALLVDGSAADSFSLHAFRRRPRRLEIAAVPIDAEAARRLDLPPASALATSTAEAFGDRGCRDEGGARPD